MPFARWDRLLFDAGQKVPLVGPCLLVLLATLVFRLTNADLLVSGLFHDGTSTGGFPLLNHPALVGLYYWGLTPAWLLGIGSLALLAASAFCSVPAGGKRGAVFLLVLLAVGPISLVNVAYKGYWGRPRPDQTTHFGGSRPFLHVLEKGPVGDYHSFPSGHATAGFCMLAPAFLLYRRRPRLAGACLAFGLMCGVVVGMGRVMQGRHFASDVAWAAAVVYFTGCALDYLILDKTTPPRKRARPAAADRRSAPSKEGSKPRIPAALPTKQRREAA
ncbi:MAG: phosphatase PAP2 family protein [Thermoguttaceae bacterium]|jgi:membrane-associated PAP2 superfamily phosphatase|nr:phosphatase PAP2 family protein [Thermoguttaceae bacterium]